MTRTEAIKILSCRDNRGVPIVWQNGYVDAVDTAIEALSCAESQCESAQVSARWIPCSERLPDKDFTDYLVQIGHGEYALYETAYRVRGRWVFYSDRQDGEGQSVIAWMPLPEPYK